MSMLRSPLARRLMALTVVGAIAWAALAPLAVRADDVDPEAVADARDAAESRSATFQAVSGAVGEDVPGGPLLVAAYGAVLVLVLGYVLYLGSLTAGASRDLERLESAIAARTPDYRKSARGEEIASEIAPKDAAPSETASKGEA